MRNVLLAMGRFLGFLFVLLLMLTVPIAVYSGVATVPISQTWNAIKAPTLIAVVPLLALSSSTQTADKAPRN